MPRVVVLGGTGFVGSSIVACLKDAGIETVITSSTDVDLRYPESVPILDSVLSPEDVLIFVSALTPDRDKSIASTMDNIAMAANVCATPSLARCSHLIYLSSDAVYGDSPSLVSEGSECRPSSLYGWMHLVREAMLKEVLSESHVPLLILRPTLLYGPADSHDAYSVNRFMRTALTDGEIRLFGNGEELRDHVDVRDVAQLVLLGIQRRSEGCLNIATGESVSYRQLAETVKARIQHDVSILNCPRETPVWHRRYDRTAVVEAFPDFENTPLDAGIADLEAELSALRYPRE